MDKISFSGMGFQVQETRSGPWRRLAAKARRDESNSTQNGCVRPTNPSEKYSQSDDNRDK
jgi:hypothetical protein